jgi:hypothetical protein
MEGSITQPINNLTNLRKNFYQDYREDIRAKMTNKGIDFASPPSKQKEKRSDLKQEKSSSSSNPRSYEEQK